MPAYSLEDVIALVKSDIPHSYLEGVADIEQQTYKPSKYRSVRRNWPRNGKHLGIFQVSPGLLLDSGAVKFSARDAEAIRSNVRKGTGIGGIVAALDAADSAQVQAAAVDWEWQKVKHKVKTFSDFYFYHNQGIYATRGVTHVGRQSSVAKAVINGNA